MAQGILLAQGFAPHAGAVSCKFSKLLHLEKGSFALGAGHSACAGLAPRAGAGTYFHERVKVGKGLPRGEYRFSPLGS
ncbi:MAG: hypothetical protein E7L17_06695, partial [Clostridium sp.]|uniref:hypothetical protein n=1 Tax=Clostridium sp. TaxID=1506 RepID=UPI00290FD302